MAHVGEELPLDPSSLGDLLALAELLEDNPPADYPPIEILLQRMPGLRPADINLQVIKAMAWANGIARETVN